MHDGETIRFRTTPRQWLALALYALIVIPAVVFRLVLGLGSVALNTLFEQATGGNQLLTGGLYRSILQIVGIAYAALLTLRFSRKVLARGRKGVDADGLGIRPADRKAAHLTPWAGIAEIRTRR